MFNFKEKTDYIIRNNDVDQYTADDVFIDTHIELMKKLNLAGAYHLWENGFEVGDANKEDIVEDAKILGIGIENKDIEEITEEVLDVLDNKFLELYEKNIEIAALENQLEKLEEGTEYLRGYWDNKYYTITKGYEKKYKLSIQNSQMPPHYIQEFDEIEEVINVLPNIDFIAYNEEDEEIDTY